MTSVAVIAHRKKTIGGGLEQLRSALATRGIDAPLWYEVDKSRKATKNATKAVAAGADLVLAWGGDGTVQRCVDALAGTGVALAIVPAGTANLLATNLGVPKDVDAAVDVALYGARRTLDVGRVNGERFAVMAGAGFDAVMIRDADGAMKDRVGRLAYVWTGAKALRLPTRGTRVVVDGREWFSGETSCVLVGNVGTISGGITAFADARPDDGRLDVGVVTASGVLQWFRVLGRMATGKAHRSPLVKTTSGAAIDVEFDTKTVYELDGGHRPKTKRLKVRVEPGAIKMCVPAVEVS
jgi:YegS/Rv2252/BmrU family lipid kinase